jgi:trk system potassium uptake protein TrkA
MFVVIVGCSEVGFFLSRSLAATGHEVAVIERQPQRYQLLTENMGMVALLGDGADRDVLRMAGVERADAVIALTGIDATNLVICQLAKSLAKDARTVTLVKDPKHEAIFEELGIDMVVNWVHLALNALEEGMPGRPLRHLMQLQQTGMEVVCVTVPSGADSVGKRLGDLDLPPDSIVSLMIKDGNPSQPGRQTVVEAGDEIVAVITIGLEQAFYDIFTGV